MSRTETIEWERRWALPVALCAFAAVVLFIAATMAAREGPLPTVPDAQLLREYHDVRDTMLLAAILNALSLLAFVPPLYYLFRAAAARSPSVRRGLVGIVVAGPLFLAASGVFQHLARSSAASDFATPGGGAGIPVGEYAEDLLQEEITYSIAGGLTFAGIIGFVFAVIYTALWAMRVGLLTRFFGTFGMALGASLVLLGPAFSLLALMLWMVWLGLILLGRVPGGRPPAWDAGEAIPWPRPGEEPVERRSEPEPVEGDALELTANGENPNVARRQRAKKRKRKRRQ